MELEKKQRSENRPYPRFPLAKAIQVIMCIKEKNGGNPWDQEDIATAIQVSKKSSNFAHIISAAREFGLIEKANKNDKIGLSELGKSLAYAPDEQEEKRLKQKAFLNIEIFGNVLNHYKGSDLPEMKYLGNVLKKDFGLSESHHEEFSRLFRENSNYVGITVGGSYEGGTPPLINSNGANPTVVVLSQGKASGGDRLKAFVILPFRERDQIRAAGFFKEVLNSLIVPAGDKAGFSVTTANRLGSDVIQSTIVRELEAADMVIADLTDHNPNVLFELGIRMAIQKPVQIIKAKGTGPLFDVDNMIRAYEYDPTLWRTSLEKDIPELSEHIQATWDNREKERSYFEILRKSS